MMVDTILIFGLGLGPMLQRIRYIAIAIRIKFWSYVHIATGPVHWNTKPNPETFNVFLWLFHMLRIVISFSISLMVSYKVVEIRGIDLIHMWIKFKVKWLKILVSSVLHIICGIQGNYVLENDRRKWMRVKKKHGDKGEGIGSGGLRLHT